MPNYTLTKKAVEDLSGIWNYTIDRWSEQQADKYYALLVSSFVEIADNPLLGKNYNGVILELSGFRAGRHIIFYRQISKNSIEITRILHEKMDLKNRMND